MAGMRGTAVDLPPFRVNFTWNTWSIPAKICLVRQKIRSPFRHISPENKTGIGKGAGEI